MLQKRGCRGRIRTDNAFLREINNLLGLPVFLHDNKTLWCFDFLRWLNNTKSLGKSSTIGQGPKYIVCRTRTSPLTSVSVTITQQYIILSRASLAELRDVRIRCPISSTKKIFFLLMELYLNRRMIVRPGI